MDGVNVTKLEEYFKCHKSDTYDFPPLYELCFPVLTDWFEVIKGQTKDKLMLREIDMVENDTQFLYFLPIFHPDQVFYSIASTQLVFRLYGEDVVAAAEKYTQKGSGFNRNGSFIESLCF